MAAWERFFTQDFGRAMEGAFAAGPWRGQLRQLELFRGWNCTDGLVFHTQIDGVSDGYPDAVNRYYDAYLEAIERHAPWLGKVDFLQPTNEPNYPWWSGQFHSTGKAVETWLRVFNRLDEHMRATRPDTTVLGPCVASITAFSWSGWREWVEPFLRDTTHAPGYYNYHMYDVGPWTHLAWMQMVQARAEALGRPRPRAAVTEYNYALDNPEGARAERFRWFGEQIFTALQHPDKFAMFQTFILCDDRPGGFASEAAVLYPVDGRLTPSPVYWLHWALREVRGRMLYVEPHGDAAVNVFACSPDDGHLVVAVFNDGATPRTVIVDPGLAEAGPVVEVAGSYAYISPAGVKHGVQQHPPSAEPLSIEVPPGGIRTILWSLPDGLPQRSAMTTEREYYAPLAAQPFAGPLQIAIRAEAPAGPDGTAALRLGVYSDDQLGAHGFTVRFNGRSFPVRWSDAPRGVGEDPTVWWVELPVPVSKVFEGNTVELSNVDTDYRLMFASLVVRTPPRE
jgi:hypothetical protein